MLVTKSQLVTGESYDLLVSKLRRYACCYNVLCGRSATYVHISEYHSQGVIAAPCALPNIIYVTRKQQYHLCHIFIYRIFVNMLEIYVVNVIVKL